MQQSIKPNLFLYLSGIVLVFWWSGIAGSQLYLAPALIWLFYVVYLIVKGDFPDATKNSLTSVLDWCTGKGHNIVLGFLLLNCLLWVFYVLIKYYSFNYHTFDTGIYHNILYNLSHGEFFSSFHQVNFLGNHFNFNLFFVSALYKIFPHNHWLMLAKVAAYLTCVWFIWKLCQETLPESSHKKWALVLIILWLFLYKPIVNSVRYEFQGSSLSLPFIFYAFLCLRRENWVRFGITMILLLGFKEHLAVVWIGFGCYLLLKTSRKKLGILLIILGIVALYVILKQIMPWARDYAATWGPGLTPFDDLGKKAFYGVRLLLPFAFLPLFFWRYGIMAGPAIGINLITNRDTMYTSHYHYDDVASCLLVIATILALSELKIGEVWKNHSKKRWFQVLIVICLVVFISTLPKSNLRFVRQSLPKLEHFSIIKELKTLDRTIPKDKRLSVMDVTGVYFNRREIQGFYSREGNDCSLKNQSFIIDIVGKQPAIDYIVLTKGVGSYGVADFDSCVEELNNSPLYVLEDGYEHLLVYKKQKTLPL